MQKYQLFIGIDISKSWIDVCLTLDGKKPGMPHQRFDNKPAGFKDMLRFARSFAQEHKLSGPSLTCMEHTGLYCLPLCNFLAERRLDFILESPLEIANSLGIRRGKNDKADAADIARYLFLHHEELKTYTLPIGTLLKIKNLLSLYSRLKKAEVSLKTAAKELKDFVEPSLSVQVTNISTSTVKQLKQQIKTVRSTVLDLIKGEEALYKVYKLVTSLKGIDLIIGANLLVYTNGFSGFQNARQFACYVGVAPFDYSSGTSVKRPPKVSPLANKKLKALLSNGAVSAIQHDKEIRAYYQRKVEEGKNPFLVKNNVKNKFIHRIFAVVKRGTPYVEMRQHIAK